MRRAFHFLYGVVAYAVFLGSFVYAIAFVGDFLVPRTVDTGPAASTRPASLSAARLSPSAPLGRE